MKIIDNCSHLELKLRKMTTFYEHLKNIEK